MVRQTKHWWRLPDISHTWTVAGADDAITDERIALHYAAELRQIRVYEDLEALTSTRLAFIELVGWQVPLLAE